MQKFWIVECSAVDHIERFETREDAVAAARECAAERPHHEFLVSRITAHAVAVVSGTAHVTVTHLPQPLDHPGTAEA